MILDGEIVAFDDTGKPSFNALQNRVQLKTESEITAADRGSPVAFYVFDLLYFAGIDLRHAEYADRCRYLAQCLLPTSLVKLVHHLDDGYALLDAALASGFEGVIGKRKDSRYESGKRSTLWIKVKPVQTAEFVVGGYTAGKGARAALGALLLGYWDGKRLRYASHVGSGFDERSLKLLKAKLEPLKMQRCPFVEEPEVNGPATWVEPRLVVETEFQRWTEDGSLRAPVFLRLRDDLDPKKIRRAAMKASTKSAKPIDEGSENDGLLAQLDNKKTAFELAVGSRSRTTHPSRSQRVLACRFGVASIRADQRDLLRYIVLVAEFILPHLSRSATDHDPHAGRHQWSALLSRNTGSRKNPISSRRSPSTRAPRTKAMPT